MSLTNSDNDSTLKNKKSADNAPLPPRRRLRKRNETGWWVGGFMMGFIVGLTMSLTYGWLINPRPLPTTPAELDPAGQAYYVTLVAAAYAYDHDENRAMARLTALDSTDIEAHIVTVTELLIQQEGDVRDIAALVELATLFGEVSPLMAIYRLTATATPTDAPTPSPTATTEKPLPSATWTPPPSPTIEPSATATSTAIPITLAITPTTHSTKPTITRRPPRTPTATRPPTRTPTATSTPTATPNPNAPYHVEISEMVCDRRFEGLLRVYVRDRLGNGQPGVGVLIQWADGQDKLYTGLKPNSNPGYADFAMVINRPYQVDLFTLETVEPLPEITLDETECKGMTPSWRVVFQQGVQ